MAPKKYADMVKGTDKYGEQLRMAQRFPMDVQLRDMDEAGIDKAVLTGNPRWILRDCQVFNYEIAKWGKEHPDRFIGFAHAPPLGEEGLEELDRAIKDLGFKGCMFRSNIDFKLLDSPDFYPFYKKVEELDVPLFVHPASHPLYPHAVPAALKKSVSEYEISGSPGERRVRAYNISGGAGREFDLIMAIVKLIDGGVLERFPNLNVVVSHLGGGIASILPRFYGSGGRDEETRNAVEKSMKLFSRLYFDAAGNHGDVDALKCALIKISPKRIVFGTDCPPGGQMKGTTEIKRFIQDIQSLDISDNDKQRILGGNAAALLKI